MSILADLWSEPWPALVTLGVVAAMFAAFVREIHPPEVVAICGAALLMAIGILPVGDLLAVFANPAPITLGAMFILSGALIRTGPLDAFPRPFSAWVQPRPPLASAGVPGAPPRRRPPVQHRNGLPRPAVGAGDFARDYAVASRKLACVNARDDCRQVAACAGLLGLRVGAAITTGIPRWAIGIAGRLGPIFATGRLCFVPAWLTGPVGEARWRGFSAAAYQVADAEAAGKCQQDETCDCRSVHLRYSRAE